MNIKLDKLNKTIVKCKKCPRLINFIGKISREKRKQNFNDKYWGKPVPGFVTIGVVHHHIHTKRFCAQHSGSTYPAQTHHTKDTGGKSFTKGI